jgi:hypothetical protein
MGGMNTNIYDSLIQPVKPVSPLDMATKAAELKTAMVRSQMAPAELQRAQEEAAQLHQKTQTAAEDAQDQKTLQDLYGEVQNDKSVAPEKKLEELRNRAAGKVKPRTLEQLSKQMEEHQTALQKLGDDHLKQVVEVGKEVGNTAAGILAADPASQPALYAQERNRLIQSGVATADQIPEQFDPNYLRQAAAHAMGAQNAAAAEIQRREQENKDKEAKRKARTDELATAAQTIDSVTDQESYNEWRDKLSPENKALTAATFTPANVATIKRMGLTANQQREADQASATLEETKRHDQATEEKKPEPKTYTGEMRAALVAVGAKDPDNPTPAEASKAMDRMKPAPGEKPVPKSTLVGIETRKSTAIAKSKAQLDKDIAAATVSPKDKEPTKSEQAAFEQAWEEHIERLQNAQLAYENELTTATGNDVGHNDWADRLKAPGKGAASPASAAPAQGAKPTAAAPDDPKVAKARALVSKFKVDQIVPYQGKKVKITSIDPKTGNFTYDPVPDTAPKP